jgi:hypothetical protein
LSLALPSYNEFSLFAHPRIAMKLSRLLAAFTFILTSAASFSTFAAPATYLTVDQSTASVMDAATAKAAWAGQLTAKMVKLYPVRQWGFATEVEGGFDDAKVCVITARAMMLPRAGKVLQFKPAKIATAFGSQAGATQQQCQALGKAKLDEAVKALGATLLAR